jgi:hypothetical protein
LLRRNPEDTNLGAIKTDLEFLIERVSKLPTRQEQVSWQVLRCFSDSRRERRRSIEDHREDWFVTFDKAL